MKHSLVFDILLTSTKINDKSLEKAVRLSQFASY